MSKSDVIWANPGALGLAAFGFNTILLQVHNIGLIPSTMPLIWGFFRGGTAQVIAGIIDARRGDIFGLTAFTSYGVFWIGLAFAFLLEWLGIVKLDSASLGWTMIAWGIFTGYMTFGALKISRGHILIFASLTVLFFMLAAHFFGAIPALAAGIEGLFVGGTAVYCSAAVVLHSQYQRWVLPIGLAKKNINNINIEYHPNSVEQLLKGVTTLENITEDDITKIEQVINEAKGNILPEPASGFWESKVPCWKMLHCPEPMKNACPAFKNRTLPCWQIEGTYCRALNQGTEDTNTDICQVCRVYQRWGHGEPIEVRFSGKESR